jgi:hypothetical protein
MTKKIREATKLIFGESNSFESLSAENKIEVAKIAALQELDSSLMEIDRTLTQIFNAMPE